MRYREQNSEKTEDAGDILISRCPDWFAVYTKPRQEQVALLNLERQSYECFLPMAEDTRRRRTGGEPWHESLFPRYLFLSAKPEMQSLAAVRSTRGVVGIVRTGFELTRVPAAIVAGLKKLTHPKTGLIAINAAEPSNGDKVKVMDGPLAALEGVFKEYRGAARSLLLLNILGRETAVEIDPRLLQRIN